MNTYLTIITTILVLTQIIRLIQNSIQLHRLKDKIDNDNELVTRVYMKLEMFLDDNKREKSYELFRDNDEVNKVKRGWINKIN